MYNCFVDDGITYQYMCTISAHNGKAHAYTYTFVFSTVEVHIPYFLTNNGNYSAYIFVCSIIDPYTKTCYLHNLII